MTHSFPGPSHLLARARLSSEKAACASKESPGLANRLETEAQSGPCSLDDLRQICFFSLAQFPLWSNQGLDQVLPGPFQASRESSVLCRPSPLPGFRESLVKASVRLLREVAPYLFLRPFWSEAFSCKLEPGPRLGGLLLFVEPGRFQDVIAQGKPSFLRGIKRLLMAQPGEAGATHGRPARLGPRESPPLPEQPAGWGQDWERGAGATSRLRDWSFQARRRGEGVPGDRLPLAVGQGHHSRRVESCQVCPLLQMALGFSPLPLPRAGLPAPGTGAQAAAGKLSAAPNLERWGVQKVIWNWARSPLRSQGSLWCPWLSLGGVNLGLIAELRHSGQAGRGWEAWGKAEEELGRASGSQMAGHNLEKRLEAATGRTLEWKVACLSHSSSQGL